jgi:hypothetical protein
VTNRIRLGQLEQATPLVVTPVRWKDSGTCEQAPPSGPVRDRADFPGQRHRYALANPDAKIEIQGYAVIASK